MAGETPQFMCLCHVTRCHRSASIIGSDSLPNLRRPTSSKTKDTDSKAPTQPRPSPLSKVTRPSGPPAAASTSRMSPMSSVPSPSTNAASTSGQQPTSDAFNDMPSGTPPTSALPRQLANTPYTARAASTSALSHSLAIGAEDGAQTVNSDTDGELSSETAQEELPPGTPTCS